MAKVSSHGTCISLAERRTAAEANNPQSKPSELVSSFGVLSGVCTASDMNSIESGEPLTPACTGAARSTAQTTATSKTVALEHPCIAAHKSHVWGPGDLRGAPGAFLGISNLARLVQRRYPAKFSCWWVHARMPGRAGKGWKGSERVGEGSEKGKGKGRENQGGKGASYGPGGYCQRAIGGRGSGTRPGGAGVTHSNRSNRFCRCVITPAVYQHKRVVLSGAAPRWPT